MKKEFKNKNDSIDLKQLESPGSISITYIYFYLLKQEGHDAA